MNLQNKKIMVSGIEYNINEVHGDDFNIYGRINYTDQRIYVSKDVPKDRQNQVLIHELFHAILFEAGFEEQDDEMEEIVNRASRVLTQVLLDNDIKKLLEDNLRG